MCDLPSVPPPNQQPVVSGGLPASPPADLDLAAIRTRVDAATPGPWFVEASGGYIEERRWVIAGVLRDKYGDNAISSKDEATIAFIAAARSDVPALLAEVERLRALVAARDEPCTHESCTGDEGPIAELSSRHVVRWRCDSCGAVVYSDEALAALRREVAARDTDETTLRTREECIAEVEALRTPLFEVGDGFVGIAWNSAIDAASRALREGAGS